MFYMYIFNIRIHIRTLTWKQIISMKKQEFYVFYPENHERKIECKLIKAYINRFCINENDQNEVISITSQSKSILRADAFFTNLKSEVISEVIRTVNPSWAMLMNDFIELIAIFAQTIHTNKSPKIQRGEYQMHLVWSFRNTSIFTAFGTFKYFFLLDSVVSLSRIFTSISPSDCNITLLQGHQENYASDLHSYKHELTIGDDIEIFTDELKNFNMSTHRSFTASSSKIQNFDESFATIKCKRMFFNYASRKAKFYNIYHRLYLLLAFFLTLFFEINGEIDNPEMQSFILVLGSMIACRLNESRVLLTFVYEIYLRFFIDLLTSFYFCDQPFHIKSNITVERLLSKLSKFVFLMAIFLFLYIGFLQIKFWAYYTAYFWFVLARL